jgi:hypothetical protein
MHDVELKLQRNAPSVLVAPSARAAAASVQMELLSAFSRPCNSGTDSLVSDLPLEPATDLPRRWWGGLTCQRDGACPRIEICIGYNPSLVSFVGLTP